MEGPEEFLEGPVVFGWVAEELGHALDGVGWGDVELGGEDVGEVG